MRFSFLLLERHHLISLPISTNKKLMKLFIPIFIIYSNCLVIFGRESHWPSSNTTIRSTIHPKQSSSLKLIFLFQLVSHIILVLAPFILPYCHSSIITEK